MITNLVYTLLAATSVGFILHQLKLVGGMMIGAMVGATLLNLSSGAAYMPYASRFIALTFSGMLIGSNIDRNAFLHILRMWRPAVVMIISYLMLNLVAGFAIWLMGAGDLLTALLCCIPGGISDITLLAKDVGADSGQVVVFQSVRMFFGISVILPLVSRMKTDRSGEAPVANRSTSAHGINPGGEKVLGRRLMLIAVAFGCSALGKVCNVPAGVIVFSIIGTMAYCIAFGRVKFPSWLRRIIQVLSGAYIGCGIGMDTLLGLKSMVLPALLMLVAYSLNCVLTGKLLHRHFGLDMRSSLLSLTPAGVSDMALIMADMEDFNADVIALNVLRIIISVTLFPQIDIMLSTLLS